MGSVYLTTPTAAVFDYEDATCTLIVTVTDNGVTGSKGTLMLKRREQDGAVPTTLCTLCAARAACAVCAVCCVMCAVCRVCVMCRIYILIQVVYIYSPSLLPSFPPPSGRMRGTLWGEEYDGGDRNRDHGCKRAALFVHNGRKRGRKLGHRNTREGEERSS